MDKRALGYSPGRFILRRGYPPSGIWYLLVDRLTEHVFDALRVNSYNLPLLGISLAVGRLTLDQLGQVRILDPQPVKVMKLPDISRQMDE